MRTSKLKLASFMIILWTIIFHTPFYSLSQEFVSFKMVFEDNIGNKDTLIFGYDKNATHGIDPSYGEEDLFSSFTAKDFAVYISEEEVINKILNEEEYFLLKKQIEKQRIISDTPTLQSSIAVKCKNYPITIKWQTSDEISNSYPRSLITDWYPHSWFDAVFGYEQGPFFINEMNELKLEYIGEEDFIISNDIDKDTVRFLFFSFLNNFDYGQITKVEELPINNSLFIYPNPVANNLSILGIDNPILKKAVLFSSTGKQIATFYNKNINLGEFSPGIYFLKVELKTKEYFHYKLIKQ